jgi:hypothetical protein
MKASTDATASTKAINYVEYHLTGKGDWVKNFHTHIDTTKYTVVIAGFRFVPVTSKIGMRLGERLLKNAPAGLGYTVSDEIKVPLVNVYADNWEIHDGSDPVKVNYWVIHADYAEAEPDDKKDGTWIINCLVINNSMVKFYPALTFDGVNGSGGREHVHGEVPAGLN